MSDARYTELLIEVLPAMVADPSEPAAVAAIKRAVIEFCAGSWVWRVIPDPDSVIAGSATYDLDPPSGSVVTMVSEVMVNGLKLENRSPSWLDANLPGWRTTRSVPRYFTQFDSEQIILAPVPDTTIASGLTMTLVVHPDQTATAFPRWLFDRFIYQIASGAIAYLMLMPNRPWSSPKEGFLHRENFENAINNARHAGFVALSRAPLRTAYQN